MTTTTTLGALTAGTFFRFTDRDTVYEARGNTWYGLGPGTGGPWHGDKDLLVRPLLTVEDARKLYRSRLKKELRVTNGPLKSERSLEAARKRTAATNEAIRVMRALEEAS